MLARRRRVKYLIDIANIFATAVRAIADRQYVACGRLKKFAVQLVGPQSSRRSLGRMVGVLFESQHCVIRISRIVKLHALIDVFITDNNNTSLRLRQLDKCNIT